MATVSGTPRRTRLRTAVRRKSWKILSCAPTVLQALHHDRRKSLIRFKRAGVVRNSCDFGRSSTAAVTNAGSKPYFGAFRWAHGWLTAFRPLCTLVPSFSLVLFRKVILSALARGKEIEAAVETLPPTTAGPLAVGGRIGEVAQSLGASWARLGRGLAAPYLLALFSVIAAGLIGWLRWSNSLYFFGDLKYASGTGQGAMTVVSSLMLGAAGALFLVVARELGRERQQAISVTWLSFASLAVVLALDEVLMAHEYASYRMASYGVPEVLGLIDQDIFVFIGYGVVLMMVLWCALPTILRFGTAVLPLVLFGSFMVGSQMVDFVPWTRLSRFEQQVLGPAEEGLKTLGAFSLLVYALVLTLDVIDWRVRRGQSRG